MLHKSFLAELLTSACPPSHQYKLALYRGNPDFSSGVYSTEHEHVGYGYAAGGKDIGAPQVVENDASVSLIFEVNAVEWLNADIEAESSMIYDATTGKIIRTESFGAK